MGEVKGTVVCNSCKKEFTWEFSPGGIIQPGEKMPKVKLGYGVTKADHSENEDESFEANCPFCKARNGIKVE